MQPLESRHAGLDERFVVLGKISHRSFMTPDHFSARQELSVISAGLAQFSFWNRRRVRQ
jgi:hypothetical protein